MMLRIKWWQASTYDRTFTKRTPGVSSKASILQSPQASKFATGSPLSVATGKGDFAAPLALFALPLPTTPIAPDVGTPKRKEGERELQKEGGRKGTPKGRREKGNSKKEGVRKGTPKRKE